MRRGSSCCRVRERRGLARAAANFYGHPADALKLVGVTGTNGKTTTAFLVDSILRAAGYTDGPDRHDGISHAEGQLCAAPNTTPESLDLQQIFAEIRDAGGTHVVLEASSHALAMDRLWGCHFAVAIFTNLTRDHLDYHKTFEEYFAAKRLLFEGTGAGAPDAGVINVDDPYGPQLAGLARRTLTYGLKNAADLTAKKFALSFDGLEFTAQTPAGKIEVRSPLVGRINVYNILAAIGAGIALEIPKAKIEQGIANLELVPGRFQRIDEGQPFLVVVDYAHTDDALRNLIATARELSHVGAHHHRFRRGRRPRPHQAPADGRGGGIAERLVVLTSDNPRSEDPLRIINDVVVGLQKVEREVPGRAGPRAGARDGARRGAAGRHRAAGGQRDTRRTRCCEDRTIEFDDREKARAILRRKGFAKKASTHESRN